MASEGADGRYDATIRKTEIAHERWLREQDLKLARIEAEKAVKVAKASRFGNSDYLTLRGVIAFFILLAFFIGCITYCGAQPQDPEETEQYKLCMSYEKDDSKCSGDF